MELSFEEKKQKQKILIECTLAEKGDFFKFAPSSVQPFLGGDSWSRDHTIRNQWLRRVEECMGRMHFSDYQSVLYPVVPAFECFARALSFDTTPLIQEHSKYRYEEVPLSEEEIVKKLLAGLKLETLLMQSAKKTVRQLFEQDLLEGEEIKADSTETSLNSVIEQLFKDVEGSLLGYVKVRARQAKINKRKRITETKACELPQLTAEFKNGLVVKAVDGTASFLQLLLPTIEMIKERFALVKRVRNEGLRNGDYDYEPQGELEPFEHQKVIYKIHMTLNHSADLSEMGVGKSLAVVMTIDKKLEQGKIRPGHILIICPNTLIDTWIKKHLRLGAPHLKAVPIEGSYTERLNIIMNREKLNADIFVCNFETFSMKSKFEINGKTNELPLAPLFGLVDWDMVIIDEVHKIKNPNAIRTQSIIKVFKGVPHSVILSGTINANKLYDVHAPFVFLNHAKQFNSLWHERGDKTPFELSKLHEQFVSSYFVGTGFRKSPRSFTIPELKERLEEISVRFTKAECLDLPEKVYERRMIEMDAKQAELYTALKNYLTAQLVELADSGASVTIFNILSMMTKLAEAANGWIYDDNHELVELPVNPKRDAVMDYLEDLGEEDKAVIWSRFTQDLHTVAAAISKEYGEESVAIIHGGEYCRICGSRKTERYDIMERFNDVGSPLRFIVANSAVGSHGIDLVGATYELFFSNSFVKTDRSQAEDRCHRTGMRDSLTIVDFVMKKTIDEEVLMALRSWKSMSFAFLGHLGLSTEKFFGETQQEAPVIVEHITQRPGECALAAIAMLSGKELDLVRSWTTLKYGSSKVYKGKNEQILDVVAEFLPSMKKEWQVYTERLDELRFSPELLSIPRTGTGVCVIRHEKSRNVGHAIAYSGGRVFDPARYSVVDLKVYEEWMASAKYHVEWIFCAPTEKVKEVEAMVERGLEAPVMNSVA